MRKMSSLGLLILAIALAACGRTDAPATASSASVTLKASFPTPTPPPPVQPPFLWSGSSARASLQGVTGQGVPSSAALAELKVYSGAILVVSQTLTPSAPSATLKLAKGQAYRFTLSVKDSYNNEVAWGETVAQIESDTTVVVNPRTIIRYAYMGGGFLEEGQANALYLWVYSSGYGSVGPDEYEVNYTLGEYVCNQYGYDCTFIEGDHLGSIEASSKLGVLVRAKPGSGGKRLGVKATVTGLGPDHQPQTVEAIGSVPVVTPTLPTDDGVTLGGAVANWPGGSARVRVQNVSGPNASAVGPGGSVAADGTLSAALPAGNSLKSYLSLFSIEDGSYCTSSWERRPGNFNAFQPYFGVLSSSGAYLGELSLANRDTGRYQPGYRQGILLYSDRTVSAKGSQSCDFGSGPLTYSYDFTLQQGWNLLVAEYTASGGVMTGGPFGGSLPEGLSWHYTGESPGGGGEASVGVSLDLSPPWAYLDYIGHPVAVGTPLTLRGSASDNVAVQGLELYVNLQSVPLTVTEGTLGSSTYVRFSASWTPPAPGYHRVDLVVRDKAGNSYRSYQSFQAR